MRSWALGSTPAADWLLGITGNSYNAKVPANTGLSLKEPFAFIPMVFSLAAFAMTTMILTVNGVVHESDEGTYAHLFQLLMAASLIMSAAFLFRWLARDPWQTLRILAIQIAVALLALAPVFYFHL